MPTGEGEEATDFKSTNQDYAVDYLGKKPQNKRYFHQRILEDYFLVQLIITQVYFYLNSFQNAFKVKILSEECGKDMDKFKKRQMFKLTPSLQRHEQEAKNYLR